MEVALAIFAILLISGAVSWLLTFSIFAWTWMKFVKNEEMADREARRVAAKPNYKKNAE